MHKYIYKYVALLSGISGHAQLELLARCIELTELIRWSAQGGTTWSNAGCAVNSNNHSASIHTHRLRDPAVTVWGHSKLYIQSCGTPSYVELTSSAQSTRCIELKARAGLGRWPLSIIHIRTYRVLYLILIFKRKQIKNESCAFAFCIYIHLKNISIHTQYKYAIIKNAYTIS